MNRRSERGFTLIEILTVITIISLLMVFLLPNVMGAKDDANKLIVKKNMTEIYQWVHAARDKGKLSSDGGHRMLLSGWVEHMVERTDLNRDRYFNPGPAKDDDHVLELKKRDPKEIWKTYGELSSQDTHFAGLAKAHRKMGLDKGDTPIASDDNEFQSAFRDGAIHVLMGNGTVKELMKSDLIKDHGWPDPEPKDYIYPVGPDSPHPLLKMMER